MSKHARSAIQPTRRDLKFNLDADKITTWHSAAGPNFTAFLNTFSIVLPVGERFFIDAVRAYRDQITDPELKTAVTAFIGQEAMHGREHEEYNKALFDAVPFARTFERRVAGLLSFVQRRAPKSVRLSTTIALEHFTALLADSVLRDPRMSAGSDPRFAALWRWHALEETEHKAVAYDVWETVMGRGPRAYLERCAGQLGATVIFWGMIIPAHLRVLRDEGYLGDIKGWRQFFRYTVGDIGFLRRQLLNWADYFRPGFHPWDHDNRECLKEINGFAASIQSQMQLQAVA
jgi:hypothetical protein